MLKAVIFLKAKGGIKCTDAENTSGDKGLDLVLDMVEAVLDIEIRLRRMPAFSSESLSAVNGQILACRIILLDAPEHNLDFYRI